MREIRKRERPKWMKGIIFTFIVVYVCQLFLFLPTTVNGESMSPTFEDQDKVIISKFSSIDRQDIIVFDVPGLDKYYIKRVIGLPGDEIVVEDDVLYINGEKVDEPYLEQNKKEALSMNLTGDFTLEELTGKKRVPEDSFFVMGDNRLYSSDSRFFGFISKESVIGEVKFRYYPFDGFGMPK